MTYRTAIKIQDIMTRNVISVTTEDVVTRVDEIFNEHSIHHIPVLSTQEEIVGIISKTDFERISAGMSLFKISNKEEYNQALYRSLRAGEIMTKDAICINEGETIEGAIRIFRENKVRALPVVDGKTITGIVTPYDVMLYFADNCTCK